MANPFSNMASNIPPKARIMLVLSIVFVVGIFLYVFTGIFGGNAVVSNGYANIESAPTSEKIRKDSPLDDAIFSEESEVGKVYAAAEKAETEIKKEKENASHLDAMRIKLDSEEKIRKAKKEKEDAASRLARQNKENQPTELEKLMEKRKKEQEQRAAKQSSQGASGTQGGAMPIASIDNPMQQYIQDELKFADEFMTAYTTKIGEIVVKHPVAASPLYDDSGANSGKSVQNQTAQNQQAGGTGYERFISGGEPLRLPKSVAGSKGKTSAQIKAEEEYLAKYGSGDDEDEANDEESARPASYDYPGERLAAMTLSKKEVNQDIVVGETFYAVLQIGVNTDEISPIRAVIVDNGKLNGAVLIGNPVRVGEKATLNFDKMSINGRSHGISAVALDPDTLRSGVADGVDRHTFERYSKLFAAAFIDGYSSSLTGGQTTTNTDGSSSTILDKVPKAGDQLMIGLGKVGSKFTPIFEREFDKPPTVTVLPNKAIVLMFMEDISLKRK